MTNQPTPDDMIYYCFAAKMRGYNSLAMDHLKYLFVSFFDMEDSEVHIGYYGEAPDSLLDIGRLSDNDTQLTYFATKVKINSEALLARALAMLNPTSGLCKSSATVSVSMFYYPH